MKEHTAKQVLQWLLVVLDQVDYTTGNCSPTDMVAAVLDKDVIASARTVAKTAMMEESDGKAA